MRGVEGGMGLERWEDKRGRGRDGARERWGEGEGLRERWGEREGMREWG